MLQLNSVAFLFNGFLMTDQVSVSSDRVLKRKESNDISTRSRQTSIVSEKNGKD